MPVTAPGVGAPRTPVRPITTPPPSAPSVVGARPFAAADASNVASAPSAPAATNFASAPSVPLGPRPFGAAADAYAAMPPMAPAAAPPSARPPTAPAGARSPRPQLIVVDDPSLSLPIVARRPWGLILVVLLLDVGLAVAGVLLLREGLADRPGRAAPVQRAASPTGST